MQVRHTDPDLEDPRASVEWVTSCRDCGRRRGAGTATSGALFCAVLVASIVVFWFVSPFLGAVLMIGALGGLMWSMGPLLLDRAVRWLSR